MAINADLISSIVMISIPAGSFIMGSDSSVDYGAFQSDPSPPHQVTLSAFKIQKTDVTQGQYLAVMGTNPAYYAVDLSRPVERTSWYDAIQFCNALSKLSSFDTVYSYSFSGDTNVTYDLTKNGYRLPTEAQWEYACRAGSTTEFWWGPDTNGMGAHIWWEGNNPGGTTQPVATKLPNAFGLYDMTGNVWQYCNDWYGSYSANSVTNPTGPATGVFRVLRAGCWGGFYGDYINIFRSAFRDGDMYPYHRNTNVGFRVVLPQ